MKGKVIEGIEKLRSKEVELAENSVGNKKLWHEGGEIEETEENQQQQQQRMKED